MSVVRLENEREGKEGRVRMCGGGQGRACAHVRGQGRHLDGELAEEGRGRTVQTACAWSPGDGSHRRKGISFQLALWNILTLSPDGQI